MYKYEVGSRPIRMKVFSINDKCEDRSSNASESIDLSTDKPAYHQIASVTVKLSKTLRKNQGLLEQEKILALKRHV